MKKHKLFPIWNFEKEEAWLGEMSAQGWQLVRVGFCTHEFERGEPSEYIYRLQMLENKPGSDSGRQYISFVEETGAEHIASYFSWVYFRRRAADGPFELFSDIDTRLRHMKRVVFTAGILGVVNLYNGITQLAIYLSAEAGRRLGLAPCIIMLAVGLLISYGFVRLLLTRNRLRRERKLHE